VHDLLGVSLFLMVFSAIVFLAPEFGGYFLEYNNFIPADPLKTPPHIAPVWYFTPFYSMLRATTDQMVLVLIALVLVGAVLAVRKNLVSGVMKTVVLVGAVVLSVLLYAFEAKFWGVVVMGGAVIILFFLPWLDYCPVKSIRYRPDWHKWVYAVFVVNFLVLGYLGVQAPSDVKTLIAQVGTLLYFGFFLLMPWWSRLGQCKPVPERVTFEAH
jgi:ubiquinol-cytochrome c reductase cytochrome b subunit